MNSRGSQFCEDDIPEILRIAEECGLSTWSESALLDEFESSDSIKQCVRISGSLAGFILGRVIPASSLDKGLDAEIFNIGVRTAFRREGVGSFLIDYFINECLSRSVYTIWLEVRLQNVGAIEFYKKNGFVDSHRRKAFYSSPPDDALVMRRDLSVM